MECSNPPPLTDDQISAVIDGSADPEVEAHLAACASCASRYAAARHFEQATKLQLYRQDCPPAQELADYHWGLLAHNVSTAIGEHLRSCPLCIAEREELRLFLADEHLTQPQAPPAPAPRLNLHTILAQILPGAPALALRGHADEPIVAEAGEHTILLSLRHEGTRAISITGQLLASPEEPWHTALVEVRQGGELSYMGRLDARGGFQCNLPSREPVDLRFIAEGEPAILITTLSLSPDRPE